MKKCLIALLIILTAFLTISVPQIKVEAQDDFYYYALGDSIAAGYGLTDYQNYVDGTHEFCEGSFPELISEELSLKYSNLTAVSDSVSGYNGNDLVAQLYDKEVQAHLAEADATTVCIGANNILGVVAAFFQSVNDYTVPLDLTTLEAQCDTGINRLKYQLDDMVKRIASLTSGDVYFMTIYNPYKEITELNVLLESYRSTLTTFGVLTNEQINTIQANVIAIKNLSIEVMARLNEVLYEIEGENVFIVDVYGDFESIPSNEYNSYLNVGFSVSSPAELQDFKTYILNHTDPHPSALGAQKIADIFTSKYYVTSNGHQNAQINYNPAGSVEIKCHTLSSDGITNYKWTAMVGSVPFTTNSTSDSYTIPMNNASYLGVKTISLLVEKQNAEIVPEITNQLTILPTELQSYKVVISQNGVNIDDTNPSYTGKYYNGKFSLYVGVEINFTPPSELANYSYVYKLDNVQVNLTNGKYVWTSSTSQMDTFSVEITSNSTGVTYKYNYELYLSKSYSNTLSYSGIFTQMPNNPTPITLNIYTTPEKDYEVIWYLNDNAIEIGKTFILTVEQVKHLKNQDTLLFARICSSYTTIKVLSIYDYQIDNTVNFQYALDEDSIQNLPIKVHCGSNQEVNWYYQTGTENYTLLNTNPITGSDYIIPFKTIGLGFKEYRIKSIVDGEFWSDIFTYYIYQTVQAVIVSENDNQFRLEAQSAFTPTQSYAWFLVGENDDVQIGTGKNLIYTAPSDGKYQIYCMADDYKTNTLWICNNVAFDEIELVSTVYGNYTFRIIPNVLSTAINFEWKVKNNATVLGTGKNFVFSPNATGNYVVYCLADGKSTNTISVNYIKPVDEVIEIVETKKTGYTLRVVPNEQSQVENFIWYLENEAGDDINLATGRNFEYNLQASGIYTIYVLADTRRTNTLVLDFTYIDPTDDFIELVSNVKGVYVFKVIDNELSNHTLFSWYIEGSSVVSAEGKTFTYSPTQDGKYKIYCIADTQKTNVIEINFSQIEVDRESETQGDLMLALIIFGSIGGAIGVFAFFYGIKRAYMHRKHSRRW